MAARQMNGIAGKQPADLLVAGKRIEIDEEIERKPIVEIILPFFIEELAPRLRSRGAFSAMS
ncbi:hypothetical protein ABID08_000137 [Rhizobium binae]|uniref:Uncharacterized protein n=1 Tax=Rhizobium binae TaxID=1138190 RepID=A0ABV2M8J5_9HYPH